MKKEGRRSFEGDASTAFDRGSGLAGCQLPKITQVQLMPLRNLVSYYFLGGRIVTFKHVPLSGVSIKYARCVLLRGRGAGGILPSQTCRLNVSYHVWRSEHHTRSILNPHNPVTRSPGDGVGVRGSYTTTRTEEITKPVN